MPQHVVENLTVAQQGKDLTEKDLDATVTAFNELDFQPVVTAGAATEQRGAPAHGRVIALRRVGKKLVATVETAHAGIADALRNGAKLTASVFHNLKRGGRQFRRALKSINLHGIIEPAIKRKRSGVIAVEVDGALVRNYALDDDSPTPGERLDELIRRHIAETGETSYSAAMTAVLSENPDLHREYALTDNLTPAEPVAQRNRNAQGLPDVRAERQAAGVGIQKTILDELACNPMLAQTQALKPERERRPHAVRRATQDRRARDRRISSRRSA